MKVLTVTLLLAPLSIVLLPSVIVLPDLGGIESARRAEDKVNWRRAGARARTPLTRRRRADCILVDVDLIVLVLGEVGD